MATLHPTKSTTPVPERTEEDNQRLFQLYKGWTLTERDGQVRQWVYQFGYDIQHAQKEERRWVCCLCIKQKPTKAANKAHQSIATNQQLKPKEPKEQDLINTFTKHHDKTQTQRTQQSTPQQKENSPTTPKERKTLCERARERSIPSTRPARPGTHTHHTAPHVPLDIQTIGHRTLTSDSPR
ncbi:Uncharacterized protein HZ326_20163 [Fusarium oxysporum f. sp. albedinis]|nr:Uncharacterized protein HZ326_20163 [Fusarium oxysporum f. sp. albedinis]